MFEGVVGVDVTLGELLSDAAFRVESSNTYAFMVNDNGETIIHPQLAAPSEYACGDGCWPQGSQGGRGA